jgi:hypothetical protein
MDENKNMHQEALPNQPPQERPHGLIKVLPPIEGRQRQIVRSNDQLINGERFDIEEVIEEVHPERGERHGWESKDRHLIIKEWKEGNIDFRIIRYSKPVKVSQVGHKEEESLHHFDATQKREGGDDWVTVGEDIDLEKGTGPNWIQ